MVVNGVTLLLCLAALRYFLRQKRILLVLEAALVSVWTVAFFFHRIFATPTDTLGYAIWEALLYAFLVLPFVRAIWLRRTTGLLAALRRTGRRDLAH